MRRRIPSLPKTAMKLTCAEVEEYFGHALAVLGEYNAKEQVRKRFPFYRKAFCVPCGRKVHLWICRFQLIGMTCVSLKDNAAAILCIQMEGYLFP